MAQGRRCVGCGATWRSSARWCGSCGAALSTTATRAPHRVRAGRWVAATVVGVAATAVALGAFATGDRPDAGALTSSTGAEDVELSAPAGGPDAPTAGVADGGSAPVCEAGPDPVSCRRWHVQRRGTDRLAARQVGGDLVTVAVTGVVTARSGEHGAVRWSRRVPVDPPGVDRQIAGWRRSTIGSEEVDVLAPVAGTVVVRRGRTVTFLHPDTGEPVGQTDLDLRPAATTVLGPWLLVSDGRRIRNLAVGGGSTWARDVPDDREVTLRPHGAYLHDPDGRLERLNSNTGEVAWHTDLGGPVRPLDPEVAGHGLHAVDGDRPALVAVDDAGEVRWQVELDGEVTHTAVTEDRVTVATSTPRGAVLDVLVPDGDAWVPRVRLPLPDGAPVMDLAAAGRQLVALTAGDEPQLFAATDGLLHTRRDLDHRVATVALPDARTALIADIDGVTAWSLATGTVRFHLAVPHARFVAPATTTITSANGLTRLDPDPGR
jgi:outer membrane protein assembly factor BamB